MNMYAVAKDAQPNLADFFQILGQNSRLQILAALAGREACVCHLEVLIGQRQAYISQQLGVLRRANLVLQRREGKHIYYSLKSARVLDLLRQAAEITGLRLPDVPGDVLLPVEGCTCPACLSSIMVREGGVSLSAVS